MTFEDYKRGIIKHYSRLKGDENFEINRFLFEITPGKIKAASKVVFERKNDTQDILTLSSYFKVATDKNFLKLLNTINADKFIPVLQFLEETTKKPGENVVEFAAWLLDFQPRPYQLFRTNNGKSTNGLPTPGPGKPGENKTKFYVSYPPPDFKPIWDRIKIAITISITITSAILLYFGIDWQQKECMTWKEDHYELASCPKSNTPNIILVDKELLNEFKKITVDTSYVFFDDNGIAKVWYDKTGGNIEFFNMSGNHPTNGKKLKPVTEPIIRKYVFGEE